MIRKLVSWYIFWFPFVASFLLPPSDGAHPGKEGTSTLSRTSTRRRTSTSSRFLISSLSPGPSEHRDVVGVSGVHRVESIQGVHHVDGIHGVPVGVPVGVSISIVVVVVVPLALAVDQSFPGFNEED